MGVKANLEKVYILNFFLGRFPKVTANSYQGYYWTPKMTKNGPKQHKKLFFFAQRAKKDLASAGARSRPA